MLLSDRERVSFLTEMWATARHNPRLWERLAGFRSQIRTMIQATLETTLGPVGDALRITTQQLATLVHTSIIGLSVEGVFLGDDGERRQTFEVFKQVILSGALGVPLQEMAAKVAPTKP